MTGDSRERVKRGEIRSHRDLIVWQKSMDLAEAVHGLARGFPDVERYGMTSQVTRAAISVPANVAEGYARSTRRDYANFVSIAKGSLAETETYLLLAVRFGYATHDVVAPMLSLITEISKMLTALRNRLLS